MSIVQEILAKKSGSPMTFKQGGLLFSLTSLKFWEPESQPQPTKDQATVLIGALLEYVKTHTGGHEILEAIQIWFPGFEDMSKIHMRKRFGGNGHKPEPAPQPAPEPSPSSESHPSSPKGEYPKGGGGSASSTKPEASSTKPSTPKPEASNQQPETPPAKGEAIEKLRRKIQIGKRNIWLYGPAGCGKTTICEIIANELNIPCTVIPCGAGTSATTFLGYKYPEREATPFVGAFAQAGIIVLDEFPTLEAPVAQVVNSALGNNILTATTGTFKRDPDCIIIVTANTVGTGANRQYVSNNQLDSSTLDRFSTNFIEVDYSAEYEEQYDAEVLKYIRHLRGVVTRNGLRQIVSTRSLIGACMDKAGGEDWKEALTTNWSQDEKKLI